MISVEHHDAVAVVKLDRSVTNALNLDLLGQLSKTFQSARKDPAVKGLVLTSSNEKFFSMGFDIPQLYELDREDFTLFYRAFNGVCLELFTLPKPTVAALTGHAIAGGCILALCCDYRFIAIGRKLMGLNEVKLGVPVPYLADRILWSLAGTRMARDVMESGEFFPSQDLLQMGLVDEVLPLEEVLSRSIEKAGLLGSMPQEAYGSIKQNRTEGVEKQALAREEEKEQVFMEQWYSPMARKKLKEAMDKF